MEPPRTLFQLIGPDREIAFPDLPREIKRMRDALHATVVGLHEKYSGLENRCHEAAKKLGISLFEEEAVCKAKPLYLILESDGPFRQNCGQPHALGFLAVSIGQRKLHHVYQALTLDPNYSPTPTKDHCRAALFYHSSPSTVLADLSAHYGGKWTVGFRLKSLSTFEWLSGRRTMEEYCQTLSSR